MVRGRSPPLTEHVRSARGGNYFKSVVWGVISYRGTISPILDETLHLYFKFSRVFLHNYTAAQNLTLIHVYTAWFLLPFQPHLPWLPFAHLVLAKWSSLCSLSSKLTLPSQMRPLLPSLPGIISSKPSALRESIHSAATS